MPPFIELKSGDIRRLPVGDREDLSLSPPEFRVTQKLAIDRLPELFQELLLCQLESASLPACDLLRAGMLAELFLQGSLFSRRRMWSTSKRVVHTWSLYIVRAGSGKGDVLRRSRCPSRDEGDPGLLRGLPHLAKASSSEEGERRLDDLQVRSRHTTPEEHQRARGVVQPGDPDEAVEILATAMERLRPEHGGRIAPGAAVDQFGPRDLETPQPVRVKLSEPEDPFHRNRRDHQRTQGGLADAAHGIAYRYVVKDSLRERAFARARAVQGRNHLPRQIGERVEPSLADSRIEFGCAELDVVAPDDRRTAIPLLHEGIEPARIVRRRECPASRQARRPRTRPLPLQKPDRSPGGPPGAAHPASRRSW